MNKLMLLAAALVLNMLWLSKTSAVTCTVNATSVAFGSFSPLTDITVDSTGIITVSCDVLSPYTIALSPGASGNYIPRHMTNGGNTLQYNLYLDGGHSQVWGNGTGGSASVADSTDNTPKNHTIYGRIPLSSQRNVLVGSYSDSITVTLTY